MLYTLGDPKIYEKSFNDPSVCEIYKNGIDGNYRGGIVFSTKQDAIAFSKNHREYAGYKVYGVCANVKETYEDSYLGQRCRFLIEEAVMFQLA